MVTLTDCISSNALYVFGKACTINIGNTSKKNNFKHRAPKWFNSQSYNIKIEFKKARNILIEIRQMKI